MPDKGERREREREWLDVGPGAQQRRQLRMTEAKQQGGPLSEMAPKKVDIYLGAGEVTYPM